MNNNPVLDANLACISKYNPELKYKLMRINSLENDISFSETVLKEVNLLYNGFPLHNNYGAEAEAKEIFSKLENNSLQMHVIYGFGLGYLVKHFAENSLGKVFIYEPNIEILAAVLEVVDFTEDFSKNNVLVLESGSNLPDKAFEIVSVNEDKGKMLVQYRINVFGLDKKTNTHNVVVVSKKNIPLELKQVL